MVSESVLVSIIVSQKKRRQKISFNLTHKKTHKLAIPDIDFCIPFVRNGVDMRMLGSSVPSTFGQVVT